MRNESVLPQHRLVWIVLIAFIVALFGAAMVNRLNAESAKFPVRGQVKNFELIDQNNQPVSKTSLRGHVWIAGFIFTRCAGQCIVITNGMTELNKKLANSPGIQLVSFSMDPEFDSPEILKNYANRYGGESPRWHFVTGSKDEIFRLTREDFMLAVQEAGGTKDEPIIHSSMLALVDRMGRIRGYYSGILPGEVARSLPAMRRRWSTNWASWRSRRSTPRSIQSAPSSCWLGTTSSGGGRLCCIRR